MSRSSVLKTIGAVIVLVGLWEAVVPYVGPTFGYPMPPGSEQPAWDWSASHTQRHLVPGIVAVIGGALLWARARVAVLAGSWLSLAAGIWFIVSPFVPRAWLDSGGGGTPDASIVMQIITPLGYHYVPGIVVVGSAALVLGALLIDRRQLEPVAAAGPTSRRETAESERERVPATS